MKKSILSILFSTAGVSLYASDAAARSAVNTGDTAWVLTSSALVMFMTAPALALFYGGLVKKKNVLNILMQCFITLALVSLLWITYGYSLCFSQIGRAHV